MIGATITEVDVVGTTGGGGRENGCLLDHWLKTDCKAGFIKPALGAVVVVKVVEVFKDTICGRVPAVVAIGKDGLVLNEMEVVR